MACCLPHIPGLDLFPRQIAAAVDDGHDLDPVRKGAVDDPVTLVDQFPHIVAVGLGVTVQTTTLLTHPVQVAF